MVEMTVETVFKKSELNCLLRQHYKNAVEEGILLDFETEPIFSIILVVILL